MRNHFYTFLAVAAVYLLIVSANLNLNPFEWHWFGRLFMAFAVLAWVVNFVMDLIEKKDQRNAEILDHEDEEGHYQ